MSNGSAGINNINNNGDHPVSGISNREATLVESFSQMNVDDPSELELERRRSGSTTTTMATTNITGKSRSALIYNNGAILDEEQQRQNDYSQSESGSESGSASGSESESESGIGSSSTSVSMGIGTGTAMDVDMDENEMNQATSGMSGSLTPNSQLGQKQEPCSQEQGAVLGDQQMESQQPQENIMVPVDITWQQGGEKVYVTGSFTGWRKMIGLVPVPGHPGLLHVKLQLPPGTHRFRFIVDNELRFSDYLPTATDQMGNFVNYLEVPVPRIAVARGNQPGIQESERATLSSQTMSQQQQQQQQQQDQTIDGRAGPRSEHSRIALEIENEPDDMGDGFSRFRGEIPLKPHLEYTQDIPAVFTDPTVMEQYYLTLDQQRNNHHNMAWLTPPQLPPHLENVILNSYSNSEAQGGENNSGALPIPNHVILNHLATSSIKHNTLCVASIIRYKRKYVTQILYAPLQ